MLDAKINRMDYGEQLIPPDGYSLDYAVGTTYSLDLEAIMVLPVAMFYARLLDCSTEDLHFDVLDAITRATEKIRVYCQKGKIKTPKKYNRLMAYWEKGISQIRMDSHVASFHPKVWVIRFIAEGKAPYYRLLITSRNLTYAHDWDIAFATEGYVTSRPVEKNEPLLNFLRFLEKSDRKELPKNFLSDLSCVEFSLPDGFHLLNFHPIGFETHPGGDAYLNPLEKRTWDELLCISPFVDDKTLRRVSEKVGASLTVLSRREELDGISESIIKDIGEDSFYQFSEYIRDAERLDGLADASQLEILPQNFHAKIFIGSKGNYYYWFMGSANCTQPAFGRNIEFMVELKTEQGRLSPAKMRKLLTQDRAGELPPFEAYKLMNRKDDPDGKSLQLALRKLIYDITGLNFEGQAIARSDGAEKLWDIIIKCDASQLAIPEDFKVMIKPLPEENKGPQELLGGNKNEISSFIGYGEAQLSPYLQILIQHKGEEIKSFVVEMTVELPDSRWDSIFKSIIDNKEKFLRYLAFLLIGVTPEPVASSPNGRNSTSHNGEDKNFLSTASLYENLMVAASRNPERIRAIEKVIERLKGQKSGSELIVDDDLLRLWNVFQEFASKDSA